MNHIYSPWRGEYMSSKSSKCVFCEISKNPNQDAQNRVLYRDEHSFFVINKYPYTPGHFMIIPHMHTSDLTKLDTKSWQHISLLSQKGVEILKIFGADGINIGMNLGACGGAGIPEHIHLHLIPRWMGDTNFITTIGDSRIYGVDFEEIYQKLLKITNEVLK